jgi:hypothetical protein
MMMFGLGLVSLLHIVKQFAWGLRKPRWIWDEPLPMIDGLLVWFDRGVETRLFEMTEPTPFGASFAIRRRLFERIGLFRINLVQEGSHWGGARKLNF